MQNKYGYSRQESSRLISFKINTSGGVATQYTYNLLGVHADELEKLLSHQDEYYTAYKLLPIYKDVFIIKCLPLDKAMEMVLADAIGGGSKHNVHFKEEYCIVDETTEDYLNENFLRIMSILPLSLQAKGFDALSIYLSVALLVLDLLSVPANQVWQRFSTLFIRYTKLTLAQFPEWMRVPVHYILSTGSEEFMFTDMYRRKTYWSKPGDFVVSVGNRVDGWVLKDELKQESELTQDNKNGTFTLGGQHVEYEIEHDGGSNYEVKFRTPSGLPTTVVARGTASLNTILYKILVIDKMPSPPVAKVWGNMWIYFATIESYLKEIDMDGYMLYTSPRQMMYCS